MNEIETKWINFISTLFKSSFSERILIENFHHIKFHFIESKSKGKINEIKIKTNKFNCETICFWWIGRYWCFQSSLLKEISSISSFISSFKKVSMTIVSFRIYSLFHFNYSYFHFNFSHPKKQYFYTGNEIGEMKAKTQKKWNHNKTICLNYVPKNGCLKKEYNHKK